MFMKSAIAFVYSWCFKGENRNTADTTVMLRTDEVISRKSTESGRCSVFRPLVVVSRPCVFGLEGEHSFFSVTQLLPETSRGGGGWRGFPGFVRDFPEGKGVPKFR